MGNAESIISYNNASTINANIVIDRNIRVHEWKGITADLGTPAVFNLNALQIFATFPNAARYTFVNHDESSPAEPILLVTQDGSFGLPMRFIDTTGAAREEGVIPLLPNQAVTLVLDKSSPNPSWIFFADPMDFASA